MFMGQVLQAGAGQIAARQAAVHAGIPMTVPATTINKVCLSGLNTIYLADQMIQAGDADIVVAGGMESMTQAPYLLPGARAGYRIGDQKVVDSMMYDGLFCAFDQVAMGAGTEKYAASAGLERAPQDDLAAQSHERAARAAKDGLFDNEIVPVEIPQRKGDPVVFDTDEGVRGETTAESLAGLRPAFDKAGNITAGNASQISDGGAAVIVASKAAAEELGGQPARRGRRLRPGGRARPVAAHPAVPGHQGGARAGRQAGRRHRRCSSSTRPSPPSAWRRWTTSAITDDVVNVNGGAIALGHPVGMSGTRVALTLLLELRPPRRRPRRRRPVRRRRPGRRPPRRDALAAGLQRSPEAKSDDASPLVEVAPRGASGPALAVDVRGPHQRVAGPLERSTSSGRRGRHLGRGLAVDEGVSTCAA